MPGLAELHKAEAKAFYAYGRALRGDDGHSRHSAVSPARVRARRQEWYEAMERLRKAGGSPSVVRTWLRGESVETIAKVGES